MSIPNEILAWAATLIGGGLVTLITHLLNKFFKIKTDEKNMNALKSAVGNAVLWVLSRGLTGKPAVDAALDYVKESVPAAWNANPQAARVIPKQIEGQLDTA